MMIDRKDQQGLQEWVWAKDAIVEDLDGLLISYDQCWGPDIHNLDFSSSHTRTALNKALEAK